MKKRQYVHNLREMQSLAERNYAAAASLLPDTFAVGESRTLAIGEQLTFEVRILTDAPYTTDIKIEQLQPLSPDYLKSSFTVRLYHDMQLAEMIASQGLDRFAAHYEQPNENMHQRDEKRQINNFLADWLRLCFNKGRWQDLTAQAAGMSFKFQVKHNNE
ncbi:DUF1249 domain-containing protein [Aliidiomarina minuta]|uniref:DUF1249 domain-containing protein n=1 Tax=Aliidiomarina minuta TaxID=880057 RepID=A0A432W1B9_9GAMM|nr:DUF1249 domain-containing protein [Aliidiomarina minuta]RUO22988.1 DUF1249 domain-containing protein [Aliidiomarina minuta]